VTLLIYGVLIVCTAGLAHALGANPWSASAGVLGMLIGFLLLQTPPARRWLDQLRGGRRRDGPPKSDSP
jgi:uncharacterized membrane protein HdeD (DUF308 family)